MAAGASEKLGGLLATTVRYDEGMEVLEVAAALTEKADALDN